MNRRQFLLDFLTTSGCAAVAILAGQGLTGINTAGSSAVSIWGSRKTADPGLKERKKVLRDIESKGFEPREAMFWEKTASGLIKCTLCPRFCILKPYERGYCKGRISLENRLATLNYGRPCSIGIDPIEKKPVFHMLPGSKAFSIAAAGCVFECKYCQNWQISQAAPENLTFHEMPPRAVVENAIKSGCRSIAYTYTEPAVFFEYMLDTARLAKLEGLRNVVISCGFINPEPLKMLVPFLDVMKVDLKGFTEDFYRNICGGSLAPVLKTLEILGESGILIDVVTLVIPTLNDDPEIMEKMFSWLLRNLGKDISLFLSRFSPLYRLKNLPPTPLEILESLRLKALAMGLNYVYLGNVPGHEGENTYCPECKKKLVGRTGYRITQNLIESGKCSVCKTVIPGIWE